MNNKLIVAAIVAVGLAFLAGKYSSPAKVEIKEVEKVVYKDRIVKDTDLETHKIETRKPDGTVITETDRSLKTHSDENKDVTSTKESSKIVTNRPDWRVTGLYVPAIVGFQDMRTTIDLEKRLFGEVYVGVNVSTDRTVGVSVSLGF